MRRPATASALAVVALLVLPALASARSPHTFPRGFLWGTAIAGFQAEMGQGRHLDTRSDWWAWTHDPQNRSRGVVSRDLPENGPGHYARYRRDATLARRRLGSNAFRISIEWSRIFPRPTTDIPVGDRISRRELRRLDRRASRRAVRHYARVLRAIRRRGMRPFVTVNHFSLPSWIHDPIAMRNVLATRGASDPLPPGLRRAGWLSRATVREFRKYAAYLAWKFGRQVGTWAPINEPLVVATNGYANVPGVLAGNFPPGAFSFTGAIQAVRNLEAGNAAAYRAIHRFDRRARVGLVQNMLAFEPANPASAADRRATGHANYLFNELFLNAAVRGRVDRDADGRIEPGEVRRRRKRRADFVGVNYYTRAKVTAAPPLTPRIPVLDFLPRSTYRTARDPGAPPCPTTCSDFGWESIRAACARCCAWPAATACR